MALIASYKIFNNKTVNEITDTLANLLGISPQKNVQFFYSLFVLYPNVITPEIQVNRELLILLASNTPDSVLETAKTLLENNEDKNIENLVIPVVADMVHAHCRDTQGNHTCWYFPMSLN